MPGSSWQQALGLQHQAREMLEGVVCDVPISSVSTIGTMSAFLHEKMLFSMCRVSRTYDSEVQGC